MNARAWVKSGSPSLMKTVNVATVPQLSPFRYPGGKTWLIPCIRKWLPSDAPVAELIEPFAGGGIVGLTAAVENRARAVLLVEKDIDVAAVWETIITTGQGRDLAERILNFEVSADNVRAALAQVPQTNQERAFQTILRNRVQRGGILAPGAGLIKHGENGKGLKSRWYPRTLHNRIVRIDTFRARLRFEQGDGLATIRKNVDRPDVAFFIDPPYTIAGRRLYCHSEIEHEKLFGLMRDCSGDFLMTYDNADSIRRLADTHGFQHELVAMKNTHHQSKVELLIGRCLDWVHQQDNLALPLTELVTAYP